MRFLSYLAAALLACVTFALSVTLTLPEHASETAVARRGERTPRPVMALQRPIDGTPLRTNSAAPTLPAHSASAPDMPSDEAVWDDETRASGPAPEQQTRASGLAPEQRTRASGPTPGAGPALPIANADGTAPAPAVAATPALAGSQVQSTAEDVPAPLQVAGHSLDTPLPVAPETVPTTGPEVTPAAGAPPAPALPAFVRDAVGPFASLSPAGPAEPDGADLATANQPARVTPAALAPAPPMGQSAPVEPPASASGTPASKFRHLIPAKAQFGAVRTPAPLAARAIGTYSRGCLAGATALPVDGPAWQAMRLSRNRTWGHPRLIALIERLATDAKSKDGWPGLLVGDISQPRGGPMLTGHASHQLGLDADIWLTPMPDHKLSAEERETIAATSMLAPGDVLVDPKVWTDRHVRLIKRAASYSEVERIFVHPAIKKALCQSAEASSGWLTKVRPYWGHYYHFHVRIACPPGSEGCVPQKSVPGDDGCGKELADWLKLITPKAEPAPAPAPPPTASPPVIAAKPEKKKPPLTVDEMPAACRVVLTAGHPGLPAALMPGPLSPLAAQSSAQPAGLAKASAREDVSKLAAPAPR